MEIAWHGSASISFRIGGVEVLVDPHFSRKEEYGPWYQENPHAPAMDTYLAQFSPDLVFITHGHFDHFDLHAVNKINGAKSPVFTGSAEVIQALQEYFAVPEERLLPLEAGRGVTFRGLEIKAYEGIHWITGEEGAKAAQKLRNRPDRYGVMPCGGPNLGIIITGPEGKVYVSGDTLLEGIPRERVDYAIIFTGGKGIHPVTKEPTKAIVDPEDVAYAVDKYLQPKVVIPVHYDLQPVMEPIDVPAMVEKIAQAGSRPEVVIPPYHVWIGV